jgi:hypothetical protein
MFAGGDADDAGRKVNASPSRTLMERRRAPLYIVLLLKGRSLGGRSFGIARHSQPVRDTGLANVHLGKQPKPLPCFDVLIENERS